jgi:AAA+ superfamily predicted ATPase
MNILWRTLLFILFCVQYNPSYSANPTVAPEQPTVSPEKRPAPQEPARKTPERSKSTSTKATPVTRPGLFGFLFKSRLPKNLVPTEADAKKLEAEKQKKLQAMMQRNNSIEKYATVDYALKDKVTQGDAGQDEDLLMQAFPTKALAIGKQLAARIARMPGWWDNKAMFYGPKGTGKSELIKKLAKDNNCEYVRVLAPALVNEYQGSGAQNIKREVESAIALANRTGKRVVMNIEEIDAIAKIGSQDRNVKSEESATQTTWLLLDDYRNDPRVFFVFTTNHFDKLNGTFKDRFRDAYLVEFANPHEKLREDIIKKYLKKDEISLEETLKLSPIEAKRFLNLMAKRTNGMSIRAIVNMVHSFKHYIIGVDNPKMITKGGFIKVLDESKRKSVEVKDSKEEWKKADEWMGRVSTIGHAASLPQHILNGLVSLKHLLGF